MLLIIIINYGQLMRMILNCKMNHSKARTKTGVS